MEKIDYINLLFILYFIIINIFFKFKIKQYINFYIMDN